MNALTPIETNDLVTLPDSKAALAVFVEEGAIDPFLDLIRKQIDAFVPDMSTKSGRDEIKAFAYRISRSKTALDSAGKLVVDELKELPKKVDATRKRLRDTLDAWRDEVRKPVDDFEAAEEARIKRHADAIAKISAAAQNIAGLSAKDLETRLTVVRFAYIGPACEEFLEEYQRAHAATLAILEPALAAAVQHERDQEELALLRAAQAERQRVEQEEIARKAAAEREERLKAEAADNARKEAEAAAQRQQEAADRAIREAQEQAAAADRRAAEATAAAAREIEQAEARAKAEAERQAKADEQEHQRRHADVEHKRAINTAAAEAFVKADFTQAQAIAIVTAIARGTIPAVTINY